VGDIKMNRETEQLYSELRRSRIRWDINYNKTSFIGPNSDEDLAEWIKEMVLDEIDRSGAVGDIDGEGVAKVDFMAIAQAWQP
jgi:hypothetical protein